MSDEPEIEVLVSQLFKLLESQKRDSEDLSYIKKACEFAREAHKNQKRKSGIAYITHPLEVAIILAELKTDFQTICAGLLHDVLEDTSVTELDIKNLFNEEILLLVQGATKLNKLSFSSNRDHQAENFRKLVLSIAQDMRVIIIKLADRLHNLRTLNYLSPDKQVAISKETIEIFAPLANRFGLNYFKWQLEDLCFKYLEPVAYRKIETMVQENRESREIYLDKIKNLIISEIIELNIQAEITGRVKHFYSIYKKIQRLNSEEIFDLLAIRIIVEKERQCYEVLGIIHDLFKPLPGRFKDYIAIPKSNLYRSLHTTVIGPEKRLVEIQIRTQEMHDVAEYGIAAHWKYKESQASVQTKSSYDIKFSELRQRLLDMKQEIPDAEAYNKAVKIDLFTDEIFIFSPKGDVYCLPRGSTVIDFAYSVHTDIGNQCAGAKVNDRQVALSYKLKNGDIVNIKTNKNSGPSIDWLTYIHSNSAKSKIRQWFRKNKREDYIKQGQASISEILGKQKFEELNRKKIFEKIAVSLGWQSNAEELFLRFSTGELTERQLLGRLKNQGFLQDSQEPDNSIINTSINKLTESEIYSSAKKEASKSSLKELREFEHTFAKCCQPIPGEEIVGVISRNRGIVIHRADCSNLEKIDPRKILEISWGQDSESENKQRFCTTIAIECTDRVGISRDILDKVANEKINITDINISRRESQGTALVRISIEIKSTSALKKLMSLISEIKDVFRVSRYWQSSSPIKK